MRAIRVLIPRANCRLIEEAVKGAIYIGNQAIILAKKVFAPSCRHTYYFFVAISLALLGLF